MSSCQVYATVVIGIAALACTKKHHLDKQQGLSDAITTGIHKPLQDYRGDISTANICMLESVPAGMQVEEACLNCSDAQRDEFLYYILAQHPGRTLVFVNAISAVRRVAALLKLLGLPAMALHASMQQRQRLKALDRFKGDSAGVLVATDVAARGLDITVRPPSSYCLLSTVYCLLSKVRHGRFVAIALSCPKLPLSGPLLQMLLQASVP